MSLLCDSLAPTKCTKCELCVSRLNVAIDDKESKQRLPDSRKHSTTINRDKFMTTRGAARQTRKTRIVCISDTHNQTPKLPQGDVLIHAGDMTKQGSRHELERTVRWLESTDFEAKIVIAGESMRCPSVSKIE